MFSFLAENTSSVIFEGIKYRSFFTAFPDIKSHIDYIPFLANLMRKDMPLFFYEYLANSSVQLDNILIVYHILDVIFHESYGFIYSLIASEIFLKSLNKQENESEYISPFIFLDFVTVNLLIGKTEISILQSILDFKV